MGLFSQRQASDAGKPTAIAAVDSVQTARTRARQRLIGAVVLLMIGIIGFPLIFESQPRPIPVDIPIDIPRKEAAAPLSLPKAAPAKPAATPPAAVSDGGKPAAPDNIITETRADAGREIAAPADKNAGKAPATPAASAATIKVPDAVLMAAPDKPAAAPAVPPAAAATVPDGARAQALLDGKPATAGSAADARFIVQIGAFGDPTIARETRMKVERLGLKTYTQVAETKEGKRIRVRVGPFASRADADKVVAKTRAAGLPAAVLTL